MNLQPLWMEYHGDKLTCRNTDKVDLWRMYFFDGYGKNGGAKLEKSNVIGPSSYWEGKSIEKVETIWGESLIHFHHRLLQSIKLYKEHEFIDLTNWYKTKGGKAEDYYPYLLSLFISHGILFEDYSSRCISGLDEFTNNIVMPAWEMILDAIGEAPLIVRLPWEPSMNWYPKQLKALIEHHTSQRE